MPNGAMNGEAAAAVQELKRRIERQMKALLECIHNRSADQCDTCRGKTALGLPMEQVLDQLRKEGLIEVEVAVELKQNQKPPVQYRRSLKTLVGIGIGVGFFAGLAGWESGKLIWRLIKKEAARPS